MQMQHRTVLICFFFLVVNEIKCKYENNSRLKSRRGFRRNNTLLSRIYFFNVNTKVNSFSPPESIFDKVTDRSLSCNFTERKHSDTGAFLMNFGESVCSTENYFTNKIVRSPLRKEKKGNCRQENNDMLFSASHETLK